ncbi:hypothetical protein LJR220_002477 [Bradyrhizobium sp. LjRoot220]|uniref:hypothetical protein n=1 Tax=Bradyrhizobium sp. LjRoot220 TaxID=3342284 RepID=UPI003ECF5F7B
MSPAARKDLFDHLIGAQEQRRRQRKIDRVGLCAVFFHGSKKVSIHILNTLHASKVSAQRSCLTFFTPIALFDDLFGAGDQ